MEYSQNLDLEPGYPSRLDFDHDDFVFLDSYESTSFSSTATKNFEIPPYVAFQEQQFNTFQFPYPNNTIPFSYHHPLPELEEFSQFNTNWPTKTSSPQKQPKPRNRQALDYFSLQERTPPQSLSPNPENHHQTHVQNTIKAQFQLAEDFHFTDTTSLHSTQPTQPNPYPSPKSQPSNFISNSKSNLNLNPQTQTPKEESYTTLPSTSTSTPLNPLDLPIHLPPPTIASPPPLQKPKRTRRRKIVTPEEKKRRKIAFLERNRLAANKCRRKRKNREEEVEEAYEEGKGRNEMLRGELAGLREEVEGLRAMLREVSCGEGCSAGAGIWKD